MASPFFGWKVVGAAFTVLFVVYSIQFSFGTFVDDIVADTGWSETRLQLIFAVYVFSYSGLSAVTGAFTDRFGPRRVVGLGAVLLMCGYLIWAAAGSLWVAFLGLGIVAPLGMSASWAPCNATVVRWFVERRGFALALSTSGTSLANIIAPPIAALLVQAWGWRAALASFAGLGGVGMLIASTWFRRDPESMGQHPDGSPTPPAVESGRVSASAIAPAQAMRTTTYWLILGMYALSFLVVFVPFVHSNQFAISLGVAPVTAATVISSIGIGGLAGRLFGGPLSDRFGRKQLVVVAFGLETIAFLTMSIAPGLAVLYIGAIVFGFAYGATVLMLPALVGDYFGREHAGSLVGRIFGTAGSLAAVGPYVAQLMVDSSGSYRIAFALAGIANGAALTLASRLP